MFLVGIVCIYWRMIKYCCVEQKISECERWFGRMSTIEEGLKQKTRQNVVVLDWGSRLNAALGNLGVNV